MTYLATHWADVRTKLIETIDKFTDVDLDFAPFDGAYSVRRLMSHIAHEELGEVQYGITRSLDVWPDELDLGPGDGLAAIKARLAEVHAQTDALLSGLDDAALRGAIETPWGTRGTREELLGHVLEHEIHHRAELSLILGLLGRQGLDA